MRKSKFLIFFLCELLLILRVDKKKRARHICKGTLDIEFERDWPVGLGGTLGDVTYRKLKKNIILVTRIFSGKADSAILLGSNVQ